MNHTDTKTLLQKLNTSILWVLTAAVAITACSARAVSDLPADFYMMMDVHDANSEFAQNINIRIHANGRVQYDIYNTGGVIQYDEDDVVTYEKRQIVRDGRFTLSDAQLHTLWDALRENHFFELDSAYEMAIGSSYAFIMVEAHGRKHKVDNIGIEVPEMRALVETVDAMLPDGVDFEYGQGYLP